jgi:hypothetical protein
VVELLKPRRGGFLRPFGCGWFVREFLMGNGPNGSPRIDPIMGAPQADIFYHYKRTLAQATGLDRATRAEERRARREKRPIRPENIERLTERFPLQVHWLPLSLLRCVLLESSKAGLGRAHRSGRAFGLPRPSPVRTAKKVLSANPCWQSCP